MDFFVQLIAAITAATVWGSIAFLATFVPGGKRGCAVTVAVVLSIAGIALCGAFAPSVRVGAGAGAVVGALIGAACGTIGAPKKKRK